MKLLSYTGCLDSVPQAAATVPWAADSRVSLQGAISGSRQFLLRQRHLTAAMSMSVGPVLRKFQGKAVRWLRHWCSPLQRQLACLPQSDRLLFWITKPYTQHSLIYPIAKMQKALRKSHYAQIWTEYIYIYTDTFMSVSRTVAAQYWLCKWKESSQNQNSSPLKPNRPQHDCPATCVTAQQYTSVTFVTLHLIPSSEISRMSLF